MQDHDGRQSPHEQGHENYASSDDNKEREDVTGRQSPVLTRGLTIYRHFIASTMLALVETTFAHMVEQSRAREEEKERESANSAVEETNILTPRTVLPTASMPTASAFKAAFYHILPQCGMLDYVARSEAAILGLNVDLAEEAPYDPRRADVFAAVAVPYFRALDEKQASLDTLKRQLVDAILHYVVFEEFGHTEVVEAISTTTPPSSLSPSEPSENVFETFEMATASTRPTPWARVAIDMTLSFVANQYDALVTASSTS